MVLRKGMRPHLGEYDSVNVVRGKKNKDRAIGNEIKTLEGEEKKE